MGNILSFDDDSEENLEEIDQEPIKKKIENLNI